MTLLTLATLIGILSPIVAGIVWGVRLEGKINVHDEKFKTVDVKFTSQDKIAELQNVDIINRLERIERKQDTAIGTVHSA